MSELQQTAAWLVLRVLPIDIPAGGPKHSAEGSAECRGEKEEERAGEQCCGHEDLAFPNLDNE